MRKFDFKQDYGPAGVRYIYGQFESARACSFRQVARKTYEEAESAIFMACNHKTLSKDVVHYPSDGIKASWNSDADEDLTVVRELVNQGWTHPGTEYKIGWTKKWNVVEIALVSGGQGITVWVRSPNLFEVKTRKFVSLKKAKAFAEYLMDTTSLTSLHDTIVGYPMSNEWMADE